MQQSHHTKLLYFDTQSKQTTTKNMSIEKKFRPLSKTLLSLINVEMECKDFMQEMQQPQTNPFKEQNTQIQWERIHDHVNRSMEDLWENVTFVQYKTKEYEEKSNSSA